MRRLALLSLIVAASAFGAENDLSVGWIARLPRIDYVWDSPNPTVEGWPAEGSTVKWVANVRWLGSDPLKGVSYRWTIDGVEARTGTLDFPADGVVQSELPWTWTSARHEIAFEIDSDHTIAETEERNNRLLVYSNAIGIGLYVERGFRDLMGPRIKAAAIGGTTFEDWMQIQTRRFNEMAQYAVYPESPNGVLDRWRIDDIHLVEDGALPLAPPYAEARDWGAGPNSFPTIYPNVLDHTVDIQWGFPASLPYDANPWILTIGNSIVHEWCHTRTMIDVYAWTLTGLTDIVKLDPVPPSFGAGHYFYAALDGGIMNLEWGHIDRYTAAAMNRMAGRRAVRGNYNEPWDLGWFLNDLPAQNRVRLLRLDGTPIVNRKVILHRANGAPVADWQSTNRPYPMTFEPGGGTTLTTDGQGRILVGHNPFSDGNIFAFVEKANGTVIVEIEDGNTRRWAYLESLQFNLAYWSGHTDLADYDVIVGGSLCADQLGPGTFAPLQQELVTTREVTLRFPVRADVDYQLWYAVNGEAPVKVEVPAITGNNRNAVTLSSLPNGRILWWTVEETKSPPCSPHHSSIYAFDHQFEQRKQRAVRP